MVNFNEFYEKDDKWTRINNQLIIKTNENDIKNNNQNYFASIIVFNENTSDIKHYIKISILLKENGLIKLPSIIRIKICRENFQDTIKSLTIQKVANKVSIETNDVNKEPVKLDDNDENKIMFIISEYINSFDTLANDENVQKGLSEINPSLKNSIINIFNLWKNFDIDTYIKQQKYLLKIQELEYQQRIRPIQNQIELLEQIKHDDKVKNLKMN